jgi:phage I-like protein
MSRKDRLNEVYEYVRSHYPVHTKNDFADKIKYHRTYISSAMHGNERYLTDKLFMNICEAFPGVYDIDYLLSGKGSLLKTEEKEEVHNEELEKLYNPQPIDQSSLINALLAAKDETIESLKRELAAKDETIALQRSRIADLERQTSTSTLSDLSSYPFAIGAAEGDKITRTK